MSNRLHQATRNIEQLIDRVRSVSVRIKDNIASSHQKIDGMKRVLAALSPQQILARGFSITRNSSGKVIKSAHDIRTGEELTTTLADGSVSSVVQKVGS